MEYVVVSGLGSYDGRYELDLQETGLNGYELGWLKRFAGYLPDDLDMRDPQVRLVLALIGMYRAGKFEPKEAAQMFDRLSERPFQDLLTLESDGEPEPEEAEPRPPQQSSNLNGDTSGPGSSTSSAVSPLLPSVSGTPGSDTSESARTRSAS